MNSNSQTAEKKAAPAVYEKLSVRALRCMYTADILTGVILFAVIGAVNWFWILPEDITAGRWISLVLSVLLLIEVLISRAFPGLLGDKGQRENNHHHE